MQDVFTYAKLLALFVIMATGVVQLGRGKTENFTWDNTETDFTKIALSFYSGLFAYNGWNYLNFVIEELQDPVRNLPRAIGISIILVTIVYAFTNVAFYTTLSVPEVLGSEAVAVVSHHKILFLFKIMASLSHCVMNIPPILETVFFLNFVFRIHTELRSEVRHINRVFSLMNIKYNCRLSLKLSTEGLLFSSLSLSPSLPSEVSEYFSHPSHRQRRPSGVNGILLTSSRLFYAGARNGQMPEILSMIQVSKSTPAPAVIFCVSEANCRHFRVESFKFLGSSLHDLPDLLQYLYTDRVHRICYLGENH